MASGNETTTKFKVDISELKKGIQEANRQIRLANAEFKAASASMESWGKSADGLTAKINQTEKVLKAQKAILNDYKKQLALIVAEYGESSKEADEMRIKIENQRATVIKTEKSLGDYKSKLAQLEAEQKKAAEAAKQQDTGLAKLTSTIDDQQSELDQLKSKYKSVILEQGENSKSAKDLAGQIDKLSSELNDNRAKLSEVDKAADDLDNTLDDVSDSAKDAANGGFTVLKGALASLVADGVRLALNGLKKLGTEIVNVGKKSLGNYAEYEQLVGGVETLFKDSAKQVQKYANRAFKTAGLSANDYMETVTSFSASLLQGLNGDTAKAAKIADRAITDMSDNANKMGTSMESIQNAYQGFAKQNYTMLDNLKLGYGGTQAEMARLINDSGVLGDEIKVTAKTVNGVSFDKIIEAIHVVQTEMGITGTTAKEAAETIEGSKNAMQASWQNLLTGLAYENADLDDLWETFVSSAETYLNNILPRIETLVGNAVDFVKEKLEEKFPDAMKVVETVFGAIKSTFGWIIDNKDGIISALSGIGAAMVAWKLSTVVSGVIGLVKAIRMMGAAAAFAAAKQWLLNSSLMANPVALVVAAIAGLVTAFVVLWKRSESFRKFWQGLWGGIKKAAQVAWQVIKDFALAAWDIIKNLWSKAPAFFSAVWDNIKKVFSAVKKVLSGDFSGAWNLIKQVWGNVKKFFSDVWEGIKGVFSRIDQYFGGIFSKAWDAIKGVWNVVATWFSDHVITPIANLFSGIWETITNIFTSIWDAIKGVWETVATWFNDNVITPIKNFFSPLVEWFAALFGSIWNTIKSVFEVIAQLAEGCVTIIKTVWGVVSEWFSTHVTEPIANFFSALWSGIKNAASTAWNGIKTVWNAVSGWFKKTIITPVSEFFSGMWDGLKTGASKAWDGIKSVFSHVSDWFKDVFSKAWQKVKDVFSTGGKVFEGIKDGIVSAFKTVVNALIRGINKVISLPFKAINGILDKIQNISVLGVKPFEFLKSRISIPEIPELASGGVLKRGQVGLLEGNGAEAVVPLENNKRWIAATASQLKKALVSEGVLGSAGGAAPAVTNNYNFTQNNTSPKPLSRLEIYRQSKNLLSLKGAT